MDFEVTSMARISRVERDPERGQRLEEALRIRNIRKMYVLAIEMGVSESTISRWRKGAPIATENLIKLCQILDISADWLLLARGSIDQHILLNVNHDERVLLSLTRSLPSGFLTHFSRALETVLAK